jgi:thioredoxin reductase
MAEAVDVVIVGGGVIGLSVALALAREGVRPTVLDRRATALSCARLVERPALPSMVGIASCRDGYRHRLPAHRWR